MFLGMARFFSRVALIVAIGYAGVVAAFLVAAWHFAEPEGFAFDLLFIGLPWSLAYVALPNRPWFHADSNSSMSQMDDQRSCRRYLCNPTAQELVDKLFRINKSVSASFRRQ
jgi:hypothetical protein